MSSHQISVTINGEEHTREVEARLLLVHFIREELGLTGTHIGATPRPAAPARCS